MGSLVEFITPLHKRSKRDYIARVNQFPKAHCSVIAKQYGYDYWDGERQYGYGGYHYDGRWEVVARQMIDRYKLSPDASILDVGCGKGFLLYEFKKLLPNCTVKGLDISEYAIQHAKEEIREHLVQGHARELPFPDKSFDLVVSNTTFHNLKIFDLINAIKEVNRVSRKDAWICVESYRNDEEKANLLYWQLTCESFYSPEEWIWLYETNGFKGDYEFVYFE